MRMWDQLSEAERLVVFFDHCGCLGISELVRCLSGDDYEAKVIAFRASDVSLLIGQNILIRGEFSYIRREENPFEPFIYLAQLFEDFSIEVQQAVNLLCLEVALALHGVGQRENYGHIDISFG